MTWLEGYRQPGIPGPFRKESGRPREPSSSRERLARRSFERPKSGTARGASALCGFATSLGPFIAMRVLEGIGGAMMVPVGRLIVLQETPMDRLITAIATLT